MDYNDILNKPIVNSTIGMRYSDRVIYENGAVKQVMFDGGHATFDAKGVSGWHYFLCDHAGSVRVVADMWDRAEQKSHYYPYELIHKPLQGRVEARPHPTPCSAGCLPAASTATRYNMTKIFSRREKSRFSRAVERSETPGLRASPISFPDRESSTVRQDDSYGNI